MQPIIILGTQRSGSNLLRLMLNQHSQIAAPHPPHVMLTFTSLLPKYGDLNIDANFLQLVSDVCRFVMLNPVSWGIEYVAENVAAKTKNRTLAGVYQVIYETYAASQQKNF